MQFRAGCLSPVVFIPLLFLAFFQVLLVSPQVLAQVDTSSATLSGRLQFTNSNPAVLEILASGHGMDGGRILAVGLGLSPATNSWTFPRTSSPTQVDYEITLPAPQSGLNYRLAPEAGLDLDGREVYIFTPKQSASLVAGNSTAALDFQECAGLVDVRFVDPSGAPSTISGRYFYGYREVTPGSNTWTQQAYAFETAKAITNEYIAVRGDGTRNRIDLTYTTGSDYYNNTVRRFCQGYVTVGCDEIVTMVCEVPQTDNLGRIVGNLDILGETEHETDRLTYLTAFTGPANNIRYDKLFGSPSSGAFAFENLMPSNTVSPTRGYIVFGETAFRSGYATQYFRTPWTYNREIEVLPGQTSDIGNELVVNPGTVQGNIRIAGPENSLASGCPSTLYRDADRDSDGDGLPDSLWIQNTFVHAIGVNDKPSGATRSAYGGLARAGFAGAYEPATSSFVGNYSMALGGLNGHASVWNVSELALRFHNSSADGGFTKHETSWVRLQDWKIPNATVIPGQAVERNHNYCLSEVRLWYKNDASTFYNPNTRFSGSYVGTDFQGKAANYRIIQGLSNGMPREITNAGNTGLSVMCLPQGSYTLNPKVDALNSDGSVTNAEFPSLALKVGCGEVLSIGSGIFILLEPQPAETGLETAILNGSVVSDELVRSVSFTHNLGPAQPVCNDCGKNPPFSIPLSLVAGTNKFYISAEDIFGQTANKEISINYNPPVIAKKVTLCHYPPGNPANAHTISVSQNAVAAHLAHGDSLDKCETKPVGKAGR